MLTIAEAGPLTQRVAVKNSVQPALTKSQVIGNVADSQQMYLAVALEPRYGKELQAFCDSVSDPKSPNYRQYLTPEQVGEQFGASAQDVANTVSYFRSQGLKIDLVSPNRMSLLVSGSAVQVEKAFGTQIKNYSGPDPSGKKIAFFANSTALTVPSNIAPVIQYVGGIDDYARPIPLTTLSPAMGRTLYNTAPSYAAGYHGEGRTIAFSNWDNFRLADGNTFISAFSLPTPVGGAMSNVHVVVVGAGHNTVTAGGEGNLDLQMLLGAAPLADIYIYDSTQSLLGVLTREASDNLADIISESWGWRGLGTSGFTSCHNQHLAMTAQGITYLCASGDSGTSGVNGANAYPYPNTDPEVTSVGGTLATTNGSGVRSSEVGWSGSGGGWCTDQSNYLFNTHPAWQVGSTVPTGINYRMVPDVGMQADSSSGAFYIYYNGSLSGISGTSCSSPFFTGCLATLQQRMVALGLPGRMGRMNDLIYAENGNPAIWLDITSGSSNGTLPNGSSSTNHAGWDYVTGFGAPNFDGWYNVLSTRPISGTCTLQGLTVSPNGQSVTVQLYSGASVVDTKVGALNAASQLTVNSQAPGGTYDVYFKASHWLRKKVTGQSFGLNGITGISVSLVNGDVNGDNVISISDFNQLRAAMGSVPGDANWNANADLNGDGTVSIGDFLILRGNFGQSGD